MSKPIIAVDLDDVLGNENHAMMHFMNQHYGYTHTPEDYNVTGEYGPYWWKIWGVDEAEGLKRYEEFVAAKVAYEVVLEPLPGAIKVLSHLKKSYDLVIITSRPAPLLEVTERWLEEHYPKLFDGVHFVKLWAEGKKVTKAEIGKALGARYLIDDSAEHCTFAQESGIQALLFGDYGWNRAVSLPAGVVRVGDWLAVQEYFDGI
jgi:5'(3')-deoxyribonucleotidase